MFTIVLGYNEKGRPEYARQLAETTGTEHIIFPENGQHRRDIRKLVILWVADNKDLVIETHSEMILADFGLLIEKKWLAPERVQVVIVEGKDDVASGVRMFRFDEEGALDNDWPIGWFARTE